MKSSDPALNTRTYLYMDHGSVAFALYSTLITVTDGHEDMFKDICISVLPLSLLDRFAFLHMYIVMCIVM